MIAKHHGIFVRMKNAFFVVLDQRYKLTSDTSFANFYNMRYQKSKFLIKMATILSQIFPKKFPVIDISTCTGRMHSRMHFSSPWN